VKYWEIIADNLSKAGWNWGCVSAIDSSGRTILVADAHRDAQRFIVRADEKLTAFLELESAIRTAETCENPALRGVRVSGNNGKQAYLFSATASPMILAATGQATVNPKKGPKSCIAASPVTYRFRRFV
jgi:hypothetical protein